MSLGVGPIIGGSLRCLPTSMLYTIPYARQSEVRGASLEGARALGVKPWRAQTKRVSRAAPCPSPLVVADMRSYLHPSRRPSSTRGAFFERPTTTAAEYLVKYAPALDKIG